MSNQIRHNKITNNWVILSPKRGKRPKDFASDYGTVQSKDKFDPDCPFCPGNEGMLPGILYEWPENGGGVEAGWRCRVVPNKYPIVSFEHERSPHTPEIKSAHGSHEVIIETPVHNEHLAEMEPSGLRDVIEVMQRRYVYHLSEFPQIQTVVLFRNHGARAGTSLAHPHSQLLSLEMVPPYIENIINNAKEHYHRHESCLWCEMLEHEREVGIRTVCENGDFLCFVPFAAEVPFELWIFPTEHKCNFSFISDSEKDSLADILSRSLGMIWAKLGDPDYNIVFHNHCRQEESGPELHWYIQIRPKLTNAAGFEIGSGMLVNPSVPENDAAALKAG
jgi:UDPglucose--hexose-1-phosphate uridylyltransferase